MWKFRVQTRITTKNDLPNNVDFASCVRPYKHAKERIYN